MSLDVSRLNDLRRSNNLLTINEIIDLNNKQNVIYDPISVLISNSVVIGTGNTIYPCVSILCSADQELTIGDNNYFHSSTTFEASKGAICIGSNNQFGEGGFTAKANHSGSSITIENLGRYVNGVSVFGNTRLCEGSQVIGQVTVQNCTLESGGDHTTVNPDERGGLLKGSGVARNLTVRKGFVVVGNGAFSPDDMERQSNYHPKKK